MVKLPFRRPGTSAWFMAALALAGVCAWLCCTATQAQAVPRITPHMSGYQKPDEKVPAPELDGGVEWLNTAGPIRLKDLRGKIVLLDFWTYCCINCIHIIPDLAKLEKKYANQLVVIGVHSAKFETEKDSKNIREAILRYNIEHPVINDANHKIWNAYFVRSWPTFYMIDPEGNIFGRGSGEGLYDPIEEAIEKLIKEHRAKKTLNETPLRFDLAKFKERKEAPLYFPGKVLADAAGKRIFIADSSHHRIVVTDLDGKMLAVAGTGEDGKKDGPFDQATFNDPQGMALRGDVLFVADRKNHSIRALDLKKQTVSTVAGTGAQGHDRAARGDPRKIGLNSPWDILLHGDELYIAQAGHHQIWRILMKQNILEPFAGTGQEDILDGPRARSNLAQPSGLTSDGQWLYFADSEVSAVRAVGIDPRVNLVKTLVGHGLFDFGDVDGTLAVARLQHPLGVAYHKGQLYVADTYNNKIKVIDQAKKTCRTFVGDKKPGRDDNPPRFDEPAGISISGDKLYVADTNNHAIRIVDLKTKQVSTLMLQGVTPPAPPRVSDKPNFPNPVTSKVEEKTIPTSGEITLEVKLNLPVGFKLSPAAPIQWLAEAPGFELMGSEAKPKNSFSIKLPADKLDKANMLKLSIVFFSCQEGGEGLCLIQSQIWEIAVKPDAAAKEGTIQLTAIVVKK
jgi:thiol-disulfide isomerase/thioredoxin